MRMKDLIKKYDPNMEEKNIVRLIKRNMLPELLQYMDQFPVDNVSDLIDWLVKLKKLITETLTQGRRETRIALL